MDAVDERDTAFVRRGPGRRPKVMAANLDRVFVVTAVRDPDPALELVDRVLVVAEAGGMAPTLVVNKIDLDGAPERARELRVLYEAVGYEVVAVSARSGEGVDRLAEGICRGSSALIGPSGVGKSTLLNAVDPSLDLRTGDLSRKTGRGRHTTVNARLLELACGGRVADTPGFGDVGPWGVEAGELASCFPEMWPLVAGCRFRGCAHMEEPDCAVREAVERGDVPESRYETYRVLRTEADRPDW